MYFHNVVLKEFMGDNGAECVTKLIKIYNILTSKAVTNVDTLVKANLQYGYPSVELEPVGVAGLPDSGSQAFSAVVSVLKALQVRYDITGFII